MTTLVVCGQDIRELSLAWLEDGKLVQYVHDKIDAERYLEGIAMHIAAWRKTWQEIDEVVVVAGPGAFTASRLSTTIVNALVFARQIPVRVLENQEKQTLENLVISGQLAQATPVRYATPVYDRPPNITVPKQHH